MGPSKCTPKLRAENHDEEAIPAAGTQGTCGVYSQPNVAAYANICDSLSCLCMARYQVIACMPLLFACPRGCCLRLTVTGTPALAGLCQVAPGPAHVELSCRVRPALSEVSKLRAGGAAATHAPYPRLFHSVRTWQPPVTVGANPALEQVNLLRTAVSLGRVAAQQPSKAEPSSLCSSETPRLGKSWLVVSGRALTAQ